MQIPKTILVPGANGGAPRTLNLNLPDDVATLSRDQFVARVLDGQGLKGAERQRTASVLGTLFDQADVDRSGRLDHPNEIADSINRLVQEAEAREVIGALKAQLDTRATAVTGAASTATSGNFMARGLNALVNMAKGNRDAMQASASNAVRLYRTELPADLDRFHGMLVAAGSDPGKLAAAREFMAGALTKADLAGQQFDDKLKGMQSSNKFWSGLTADVTAGLLVLGGTALCITGFGAPIGAGMIAGAVVVGGAATVGAHALLDNQYDFRHEALGNFMVGGISAGAMVLTAGASQAVTQTVGRVAVTQAGIGGMTSLAAEGSHGFQAGWTGRVLLGVGTGAVLGGATHGVASRLLGSGSYSPLATRLANTGVGAVAGGAGAGGGAFANEALAGFPPGWEARVAEQSLGGSLAGAAYAQGPNLAARNQAAKQYRAAEAAAIKAAAAPQARVASAASGYAEGGAAPEAVPSQVGRRASKVEFADPGSKRIVTIANAEFKGFAIENGQVVMRVLDPAGGNKVTIPADIKNKGLFGVVVPKQLGQKVPAMTATINGKPTVIPEAVVTYVSADGKHMTLTPPGKQPVHLVPATAVMGTLPAVRIRPSGEVLAKQAALHQELARKGVTTPQGVLDHLATDLVKGLERNPAILAAFKDAKQPIMSLREAPAAWARLSPEAQKAIAPKLAAAVTEQAGKTYRIAAPEVSFEETPGLAGFYKNGKVVLNPAAFKGSFVALLDTLVHEPTHAYQGFLAANAHDIKGLSPQMVQQVEQYQRGFQAEHYVNPAPDTLKGNFTRDRFANRAVQETLYREVSAMAHSGMEKAMVREWWQQWAFKVAAPADYAKMNTDLYNRWMGQYKTQPLEAQANRVSHQVTQALTGQTHVDWRAPFPEIKKPTPPVRRW